MGECVNGQTLVEGVKGANEDYVRGVQFFIRFALVQQFSINHALVKTAAFGQVVLGGVGALHLDVIDSAFVIFYIDIQTDAFAVQAEVYGLFEIQVAKRTDFDVQDFFDEMGAKPFIAHDMLEEKVVPDSEFVKSLDFFHCSASL